METAWWRALWGVVGDFGRQPVVADRSARHLVARVCVGSGKSGRGQPVVIGSADRVPHVDVCRRCLGVSWQQRPDHHGFDGLGGEDWRRRALACKQIIVVMAMIMTMIITPAVVLHLPPVSKHVMISYVCADRQ